jgi:deazaflavin-dependent oxidoreductase (nitroreductase family)
MRWLNQRVARRFAANEKGGDLKLLLTTTGRKSGLPRVTPLQFEEVDDVYYVASARGQEADWFRNLLANPQVEIQVRGQRISALAEPITEAKRIADFLELRLERHPRMIGAMLRLEGLPSRYSRADLEEFAASIAAVAIHPIRNPEA